MTESLKISRLDALGIALGYGAVAAIWIFLSDYAVQAFLSLPGHRWLANIVKGWIFVAATSLLLYAVLRGLSRPSNDAPAGQQRLGFPFLIVAVSIALLTGVAIARTLDNVRGRHLALLESVADLKAAQLSDWLAERRGDAERLGDSVHLAGLYKRWRDGGDAAAQAGLQIGLSQHREDRGFGSFSLFDPEGRRLLHAEGAPAEPAPVLKDAVRATARDGQVRHLGPYCSLAGQVRLDLVAPLRAAAVPPPVMVLHIDPRAWLFPTLQAWTIPSKSGEIVLVRREGDRVQYLNALRTQEGAAASMTRPLADHPLLAAQVLRGEIGPGQMATGLDHRGVPAVGAVRAIAGTDWSLIAKMYRRELYDGAIQAAIPVVLAGLLALFVSGAGLVLLRQRARLAAAERLRVSQAERLRALRLLGAIAEASDDAIFAKDLEGRYLLFNRAAIGFAGKPATAVLGCDDRALFPPGEAETLQANDRRTLEEDRVITCEEVLSTAQGVRTFLATKGPLRDADGTLTGTFGISRDITERRRDEQALRENEGRFRALVEQTLAGIFIIQDGRLVYVNREAAAILGFDRPEDLMGQVAVADLAAPEDLGRVAEDIRQALDLSRPAVHDVVTVLRRDGTRADLEVHGNAFVHQGRPAVIGLALDITARRKAEAAERESEARFRTLFESAAVSIYIHDRESGAILDANRRAFESYGYQTLEQLQANDFWLEPPYSLDDAVALIRKAAAEGPQRFEWKNRDRHGRVFWEDVLLRPIRLGGVEQVLSVTIDITERLAAEDALRQRSEELERFNLAMVGREVDMVALKDRVNALSRELGRAPPYNLDFLDTLPGPEPSP